jgi:hypothetical protein
VAGAVLDRQPDADLNDSRTLRVVFTTNETTGSITAGETALTVASVTGYANGDTVVVTGAGPGGTNLVTTISSISGRVLTLASAATITVKNAAVGEATDPTTVTLRLRNPAGTVTTYTYALAEITKDGVGQYSKAVTFDSAGYWNYRYEGTGTVPATEEATLLVTPSAFYAASLLSPRALVTLWEAKAEIGKADQLEDLDFVQRINAVSAIFNRRREFVARNAARDAGGVVSVAAQARTFDPDRSVYWDFGRGHTLSIGDATSISSVVVRDYDAAVVQTLVLGTDYYVLPRSREEWEPIRRLRFRDTVSLTDDYVVEVTGVWGFPQVPEDIKRAVYEEIAVSIDRDTTNYRESLAVEQAAHGNQVILTGGGNKRDYRELKSPSAQAVLEAYSDLVIA